MRPTGQGLRKWQATSSKEIDIPLHERDAYQGAVEKALAMRDVDPDKTTRTVMALLVAAVLLAALAAAGQLARKLAQNAPAQPSGSRFWVKLNGKHSIGRVTILFYVGTGPGKYEPVAHTFHSSTHLHRNT